MRDFGGRFILNAGKKNEQAINNTIVGDGALRFLQLLFQADDNLPASFYLGLTGASYTFDDALLTTAAAAEPVGNGYARQELERSNVVWDITEVGGVYRCRSTSVVFTADSQWSTTWRRMFLCDAASGDTGIIYAYSGPTPSVQTVLAGEGPTVAYEFWLRGNAGA